MKKSAKKATPTAKASKGFSLEERAAMRERAKELKAAGDASADEESVLAKIEAMKEPDRAMAKRIHTIITASAPGLSPKLWYGMPAYAKNGNVICFFQDAQKFKSRYSTLGLSDKASLDDGQMWPTSFALTELTAAVESRIGAIVKKAGI